MLKRPFSISEWRVTNLTWLNNSDSPQSLSFGLGSSISGIFSVNGSGYTNFPTKLYFIDFKGKGSAGSSVSLMTGSVYTISVLNSLRIKNFTGSVSVYPTFFDFSRYQVIRSLHV